MSKDTRSFRLINPPPETDYLTDPETGEPVPNPRAGQPQPFVGLGVAHAIPTMVGGEIIETAQSVYLGGPGFLKAHRHALPSQLIPVEVSEDGQVITASGLAISILAAHELFEECDPPGGRPAAPKIGELRDEAQELGVDPHGLTKDELVAAIAAGNASKETEVAHQAAKDQAGDGTTSENEEG